MIIQYGSDLCPKSKDKGFDVDTDSDWCNSCVYCLDTNDTHCACSYEETDEEQIMDEFNQIERGKK